MSNHSNNILDGEELFQNIPLQSIFSPRWERIEKVLYPIFSTLFTIAFISYLNFITPNAIYLGEELIIVTVLFASLLGPVIYIWQFRKFRNRYMTSLSVNNNRRLIFLTATLVTLFIGILLLLLCLILAFVIFYGILDADNQGNLNWLIFALIISIPLAITSGFLCSYYVYSIRFIYRINDTLIDDILN